MATFCRFFFNLTAVFYLATVRYQQTSERTTLGSPTEVNKAFFSILEGRVITLHKSSHDNVERVMNTNGTKGSVFTEGEIHWILALKILLKGFP